MGLGMAWWQFGRVAWEPPRRSRQAANFGRGQSSHWDQGIPVELAAQPSEL